MSREELQRYDGVLLDVSHESITGEVREALDEEWYEAHEAALVRSYLPSTTDVIEFGAGIGYVSCVIDTVLEEQTNHVAVEPNESVLPVLKRTKQLNDAGYTICERAYSSRSTPVELHQEMAYWTATTQPHQEGALELPSINLETLCEQYSISQFSLVLDIEGGEYDLLTSEMSLLENQCDLLIVEFHDDGPSAQTYDNDLENSSFELVDGIESVCVYRNENC